MICSSMILRHRCVAKSRDKNALFYGLDPLIGRDVRPLTLLCFFNPPTRATINDVNDVSLHLTLLVCTETDSTIINGYANHAFKEGTVLSALSPWVHTASL